MKILSQGTKKSFTQIFHFLMEMFFAPLPMVYIFHNLFVLQEYVLMLMISTTETNFWQNSKSLNKKCHKHVTNAPKGIGLAQDTFEER